MNASKLPQNSQNIERPVRAASGWPMLAVNLVLYVFTAVLLIAAPRGALGAIVVTGAILVAVGAVLVSKGFFTLQPNEAAVLILFGAYRGTVRESGFFFTNPFNKRLRIS